MGDLSEAGNEPDEMAGIGKGCRKFGISENPLQFIKERGTTE